MVPEKEWGTFLVLKTWQQVEVDLGHGLGNINRGFEFFGDSRGFDRFVANRSLQSRIDSPEVDSLYTGTGVGNLLRFESIRSIRCESSLPKSNRHTGSLFTLGNNAGWELFYSLTTWPSLY